MTDTSDTPKPLKVLHIGKYFPPYAGGMETYLRDLMAAQVRQGLEPAALVHRSELSIRSIEETYRAGEETLLINRAGVWARLVFTPISPMFPWLLNKLLKKLKPDVLHLHMPNVSAFWVLFLPTARRVPWVVHWHSDVLASQHSKGLRLFYRLYRPFERAVLKRSKRIIATSSPYLESSEPLRDFRHKCSVVPLGLDSTMSVAPWESNRRNETSNLRVLAVGRLTYYKGFEYLIRAIADLREVELHLVGTGELLGELQQMVSDLQLKERVTFHGKIPEDALTAHYQACDCLCLPSIERTEAFGMVLLEAMSHSRPTLVSRVEGSGMSWVVEDKVSGLQFPPQDSHALAEAMAYLRDNRDKLRSLGENGRTRFDRLFYIDKSAVKLREHYKAVIDPSLQSSSK